MSFQHTLVAVLMLTISQIPSQSDHAQYLVHRVTLVGLPEGVSTRTLRKACRSIEEGRVYTAAALDKAISALNKLGMFGKITRADCAVIRSNIAPGSVDIMIKLKLKAPPGDKSGKSK